VVMTPKARAALARLAKSKDETASAVVRRLILEADAKRRYGLT
jgi:hypothetical protein